jgi:hypothetical protein
VDVIYSPMLEKQYFKRKGKQVMLAKKTPRGVIHTHTHKIIIIKLNNALTYLSQC